MMRSKPTPSTQRLAGQACGLVLDDYLHAVLEMRAFFNLPSATFGLREMESEAGAATALKAIVEKTRDVHGSEIYVLPHTLSSEFGDEVFDTRGEAQPFRRLRIRSASVAQVFRKVIEIGLQTVAQLPPRDRALKPLPRLKTLAASLEHLAEKLDAAIRNDEFRARARTLFAEGDANRERIAKVTAELRWSADTVRNLATLKLRKLRSDSPNPQVRLGMYIVQWIAVCTGSQQYAALSDLFQAAFSAANKDTPRWVHRLGVEMAQKCKRRKRWGRSVSVLS